MTKYAKSKSLRQQLAKFATIVLLSYCAVIWSGVGPAHFEMAHAASEGMEVTMTSQADDHCDQYTGGVFCKMLCDFGTCAGFGVLEKQPPAKWAGHDLHIRPSAPGSPHGWLHEGPLKPPRTRA